MFTDCLWPQATTNLQRRGRFLQITQRPRSGKGKELGESPESLGQSKWWQQPAQPCRTPSTLWAVALSAIISTWIINVTGWTSDNPGARGWEPAQTASEEEEEGEQERHKIKDPSQNFNQNQQCPFKGITSVQLFKNI